MYKELFEQYPHAVQEIETNFGKAEIPEPPVDVEYLRKQCEGDPDLELLFRQMEGYFYEYTEAVCAYAEFAFKKAYGEIDKDEVDSEESQLDQLQKRVHDATIDSVNILARAMAKAGKDTSWLEKLKDSRAKYGNLALMTTYKKLIIEKQEQREPSDETQNEHQ